MASIVVEDGDNIHTVSINHLQDGDVLLSVVTKTYGRASVVSVRMNTGQAIVLGLVRDDTPEAA